jgi:hypothetical protein
MTTTVLTMTLTGIAADSRLAGGSNPRLVQRFASVLLMLGGAAIGAVLERHGLTWPALAATGAVAVAVVLTVKTGDPEAGTAREGSKPG